MTFCRILFLSIFIVVSQGGRSANAADSIFKAHRFDDDVKLLVEKEPWLTGLKNIPLGSARLELGGEARISREWSHDESQGYWLGRYAFQASFLFPGGFRIFTQLKYSDVEGKEGAAGPLDNDYGDVQQFFIDKNWANSDGRSTMRLGRQEVTIGSGRWVSLREGPNSRLTFDSILLQQKFGDPVLELFAGRPTLIEQGDFDNEPDPNNLLVSFQGQQFWKYHDSVIDGYLMYFEKDKATYLSASGKEERYALGTRWLSASDFFKANTDVVFQWGRVEEKSILAYGLTSEMSWKVWSLISPLLKLSYFTGDGATGEGQLGTFNAFYPKGTYYGWSSQIGHPNLIAVQPGIYYLVAPDLKLISDLGFYWRQSKTDTVYRGNGTPLPMTSVTPDKNFVGSQFNAQLEWQTTNLVVTSFEFSHFFEDTGVEELRDSEFVAGRIYFKF